MRDFIAALKGAVETRNVFAALLITVSLPDIAGALMLPDEPNAGPRYKAWWTKYLLATYTRPASTVDEEIIYLSASDAWALRCAILHQGSDIIDGQRTQETLNKFVFVQPRGRMVVHQNLSGGPNGSSLNLQVDQFAGDVISGVEQFLLEYKDDVAFQGRLNDLVKIDDLSKGFTF